MDADAITKALVRRPRDHATGSTTAAGLLAAYPEPEATASEILVEARREVIRWATEQIRTEFSDEIWKLFQLTAIDGVSIGDVAQSSGRSVGSIYIARFRVITRLKEKIQAVSQHWDLKEHDS